MDQPALGDAKKLTVNSYRYERYKAYIERTVKNLGVEEVHKPETKVDPDEAEELAAADQQRLTVMMSLAGALCEEGDPPREKIEAILRNSVLVYRCRHQPPHYFDPNGMPTPRP